MSGMLTISSRSIPRNVLRLTTELIDANNSKVIKSALCTKASQKQYVLRLTKPKVCNISKTKVLTKWPHHDRLFHTTVTFQTTKVINVPPFADSVSEGDVKLDKKVGDYVAVDEIVMEIETDKTSMPVPAPEGGVIEEILVKEGDTVKAGQALFKLNTSAPAPAGGAAPAKKAATPPPPPPRPAAPRAITPRPASPKLPAPRPPSPKAPVVRPPSPKPRTRSVVAPRPPSPRPATARPPSPKPAARPPSPRPPSPKPAARQPSPKPVVGRPPSPKPVAGRPPSPKPVAGRPPSPKPVASRPPSPKAQARPASPAKFPAIAKKPPPKPAAPTVKKPLPIPTPKPRPAPPPYKPGAKPKTAKPGPPPPLPPKPQPPPKPIPPSSPKPPIVLTPNRRKAPEPAKTGAAAPSPPPKPASAPTSPPPAPPKPPAPSAQIPVAAMRHAHAIDTATIKMPPQDPTKEITGTRTQQRVKMNRMRLKIASRLKEAQNTNAMLTTFNEIDMSAIMQFRKDHLEGFIKKYGMKLGFMSAFCKASAYALQDQPVVNAVIDGGEIIYRDYVDISVAVATPRGLVVPVLRNVESMNFADIEIAINELGQKAKKGAITVEDMDGGTFTISNGGVFGSLMGTPIINPPQSSILGMHGIFDRPIAVKGQVVVRPMMYVALTYDHRLIDGREAVMFLRKVKSAVEDPRVILAGL